MSFKTYTPKDEADWLSKRFDGIGASESAALFGVSKWTTALQLFYEKTQKRSFTESNDSMRKGNYFESGILRWFEDETGVPTKHNKDKVILTPENAHYLFCTPDAFTGDKSLCEAKYSEYAPMWEDGIPLVYQIQLQHQIYVAGLEYIHLAAVVRGELITKRINRHDKFIETLLSKADEFWDRVLTNNPPPAIPEDWKLLNNIFTPKVGVVVDLPFEFNDVDSKLLEVKERIKELEHQKKGLEVQIKEAIGEAESGCIANGATYTFKELVRKRHIVKESKSRVLRRKGN